MVNVAVTAPIGTVTVAGTVTGLLPDSDTTAPPDGAALVKVTVPVTVLPPTTVFGFTAIDWRSLLPAITVSVADLVAAFDVAVMLAVPAAPAVTVKEAVDDPASTVTLAGTVATVGLLLLNDTLAPPVGAAAASVTTACTVVPAGALAGFSVMLDTAGPVVLGSVGLSDPH
jgi:hypothetical protein